MLNEVMVKYAELLDSSVKEEPAQEIELLPNRFYELDVGQPVFNEEVLFAEAADENVEVLHEKKFPQKPEDMVERAHPESVFVSPALGDGGLVENLNERHSKIVEMINKLPTGNHVHVHASIVENLVKTANDLEAAGLVQMAEEVDYLLASMTGDLKKKLTREGIAPLLAFLGFKGVVGLIGLLSLGLGLGMAGGAAASLVGIPSDIANDSAELLQFARDLPAAFPNHSQMANKIVTNLTEFHRLSKVILQGVQRKPKDHAEIQRLAQKINEARSLIAQVKEDVGYMENLGTSYWNLPKIKARVWGIEGKLDKLISSLEALGGQLEPHFNQRQRQGLPGESEVQQLREDSTEEVSESPTPAVPQPLDADAKRQVMAFMEKLRGGVTEVNLPERLDELADAVVKSVANRTGITLENLTGDRLQHADVNRLKRLVQFSRAPLQTIQYVPGQKS